MIGLYSATKEVLGEEDLIDVLYEQIKNSAVAEHLTGLKHNHEQFFVTLERIAKDRSCGRAML